MRRDCPLCYNQAALRGSCSMCKGIGTIGVRSDYASPEVIKNGFERTTVAKNTMEGIDAVKKTVDGPHWRDTKQKTPWATKETTEYKGLYGSDR